MTDNQPEQSWLALASGQPTPEDARLLALATARAAETTATPDADNPPGEAVFVLLTQRFPGAERGVLDAIASAWFEHSGLYPALATVDAAEQTLTFFKAVNVKDLPQAIRITADGVSRALSEVELGEVVPTDGYVVDVSREHAWW